MALSGLHVTCGFAGEPRGSASSIPLLGAAVWSETMANPGTTTMEAPPAPSMPALAGRPVFSVRASADAWIAVGPNPDAAAGPRRYLAANTDFDFFVEPGHKLAWTAA